MNLSEANRLPLSDLKNVYHLHCNCFVVNVIAGIAWLEAMVLFFISIILLCFAAGLECVVSLKLSNEITCWVNTLFCYSRGQCYRIRKNYNLIASETIRRKPPSKTNIQFFFWFHGIHSHPIIKIPMNNKWSLKFNPHSTSIQIINRTHHQTT